ncbi:histidine kinase dimerization/phosphoacceptor domain -containing protein [Sphingomonas jatrophae]|uniref:histidine kinase n=1 Tax=Sphingomonas jatrophae TaxID=1166337 RepID=A0A1I6K1C9_9SPHN|nr:histidine kinase dimerization/phosphoacceptor domain -containing protein [Sphingomonas jatrophae]SFR85026.1 photoactive yellow protein [Sphingomonas jatrophae]
MPDVGPEPACARLPFGRLEVDATGRILSHDSMICEPAGMSSDELIGRDLFRDVAPGTHLPAFHGRFLSGVRLGRLAADFEFVFGCDPQPVRAEVAMRDGDAPGRYRIDIRPLGVLPPTRQRSMMLAAEAVDRRLRAEPIDPSICEREPIHVPGAVQPHAAMLALNPQSLIVEVCSDNAGEPFGRAKTALLGCHVRDLMPADVVERLRMFAAADDKQDPTRPLRGRVALGEARYELTAHCHGGRLVIELELLPDRPEDFGAATPLQAQDAIARMRDAPDLVSAAVACVEEVRAMTGFDRVLVYRFDEDWNGEAITESVAEDWGDRLEGLRFPASDIPAQARALYTRAPARFVVDRDASPAPLLADPEAGNGPVDLSFAQSRALSPVHLEYQRNLGVNGSMSVSIVVEGKLWGLVIGHHRRPRYVEPETRALATLVTQGFALRVHELESRAAWDARQQHLATQQKLFEQMASSDDYVDAILTEERTLVGLFVADGAAVVRDGEVRAVGGTPSEAAVLALADWLRRGPLASDASFATDALPELFPEAEAWREVASGLLAAAIDADRRHLLIWFRREVAGTIAWGGDPNKPVLGDAAAQVVLPRRSFERWVEERRGRSDPWEPWQLSAAAAFASGIEGVILRQNRRIQVLTEQQAELTQALTQKDVLAREVDHRVKNSLQIVAAVMLMQARKVEEPTARAALEETYARVMSVARVHDSLQQTEDMESVDVGETLRQLCNDLLAGMAGEGLAVAVHADHPVMVSSQTAVALSLIATELVTNALKYAYSPGEAGRVDVSVSPEGPGLMMRVCDNGRGLPDGWESRAEQKTGGGLGMRIIRAMLQQIDARLEVGSAEPSGACFTVRV